MQVMQARPFCLHTCILLRKVMHPYRAFGIAPSRLIIICSFQSDVLRACQERELSLPRGLSHTRTTFALFPALRDLQVVTLSSFPIASRQRSTSETKKGQEVHAIPRCTMVTDEPA